MRVFKLNHSESGFTIVELLVAVGIMGLVALGLMNLSYFFQKGTRNVALKAEINYFDQKISNLLSNADNCKATIGVGTLIRNAGGTKTDLASIRTAAATGVDQVTYTADVSFLPENQLEDQHGEARGAVYPVWIESIFIYNFAETDYAETTTNTGTNQGINYALFGAQHKYGWAKIVAIFVVRQVNGKDDSNNPRYIYRRVRAEYPVPVVLDASNQLVRCVDSSIRTATSALENICMDLGGSVTFVGGEPQCAGTLGTGLQKGRRIFCADFGGTVVSSETPGQIKYKNFDCEHVHMLQHLNCDRSRLIITNNMEYKCAGDQLDPGDPAPNPFP